MKSIVKLLLFCILFTGCSVSTKIYEANKPVFNIVSYFCGATEGYGIFFDYRDRATIRFKITATGNCETPGVLKMNQNIVFEDGSTESHNREFSMIDDNHLSLTGNAIIDPEPIEQYGNAAHMEYTKIIQRGLNSIEFAVKEDMYMIDNNQVMNKINVKKMLFTFGDVVIIWRKNV